VDRYNAEDRKGERLLPWTWKAERLATAVDA
jgi:hypothetical protein